MASLNVLQPALIGLFAMIVAGYAFNFLSFESLLGHVDWDVVILLFGMMTYVGLMSKTGFFSYLGVNAIRLSKGRPLLIFIYLSIITAFISMAIDNVTTVLLMIPITIETTEMLEINPVPILLGEVLISNIGGVGTLIGDPPNIMIGLASNFSFNDFLVNLFPIVLVLIVTSILIGRITYKKWVAEKGKNTEKLLHLDPKKYIQDEKKMRLLLCVLIGMIIFFALESITGISPAAVALAGGTIALIISREDPIEAFKSVEWSTLVFFIALFALVGGLYETGLLNTFAEGIVSIQGNNVLIIALIILWLSGIMSAFVDNIPITAALIPVVSIIYQTHPAGILWWALALGAGLGGNITYIGSSAGVITVSLSRKYGHKISNREWLKYGLPVGIASLVVSSIFLFLMQQL